MRIDQFLNPIFIYKNRKQIVPYIERQRNEWKLRQFRNRHWKERCFVIGNGPSLSVDDLEKLKRESTFAANKIYLLFEQTEWRPRYFVAEDDNMLSQHSQEICNLKGFPKFVNHHWKHLFRGDPDAIWYPWRHVKKTEYPKFSDDILKAVYPGYMVTYISLQIAYFMGFIRVYLIGVDFNYSFPQNDGKNGADHFTPDYFKPGETRYAPRLDLAEQALRCAKEFYESNGRKIFNATRGGKLEVFERISLEEALRN